MESTPVAVKDEAVQKAAQTAAPKAEPVAVKDEAVQETAQAAAPKAEPVAPKERVVEEKLFLLARESTEYPDGSMGEISSFTYDGDAPLLLKKETVDSHNSLLETTIYEYEEGRPVRTTVRDGSGRLKSQRISTYTPQGFLESETLSGKDGKVASFSSYRYDALGNRIQWSVFDGSKLLLGVTTYIFQDDRNVRMDIANAAGKAERSVVIDYDDGRRTRESYRLPSGETEKYTVFAWKDGRLVSESSFRAGGEPVSRVEYAYDGNGNVQSVLIYDRTGALTQTRKREYAERTITHVERE